MAKRFLIIVLASLLAISNLIETSASPKNPKIGVIYDVGGRGDNSYNDSIAIGVEAAKLKFGLSDLDVRELVTTGLQFDRENRIEFLIKAKYDLVIGIGPSFADAMIEMGDKYPAKQFAIIGTSKVESLNTSSAVFRGDESAYLAGVMAALNSKNSKVGYLGDSENNLNVLLLKNYRAGAKSVSKKIKVFSNNSSASANSEVLALHGKGVDVIFATWSRDNSALSEIDRLASNSKRIKLIGVRPEQYFLASKAAKKYLIGYVNERYDLAVYDQFEAAVINENIIEVLKGKNGLFGRYYNLANQGLDLIATKANQVSKAAVARAKAGIISGSIKLVK